MKGAARAQGVRAGVAKGGVVMGGGEQDGKRWTFEARKMRQGDRSGVGRSTGVGACRRVNNRFNIEEEKHKTKNDGVATLAY